MIFGGHVSHQHISKFTIMSNIDLFPMSNMCLFPMVGLLSVMVLVYINKPQADIFTCNITREMLYYRNQAFRRDLARG